MPSRNRRTVLASLAAGSASLLAGCNSTSTNNSNADGTASPQPTQTQANSGNSDVIEVVEKTTTGVSESQNAPVLRVSVAKASIDAVALRNSNGTEVARKQIGTGTTIQFPLANRAAGTYDILAVQSGSIVDQQSTTIERTLTIEDVSFVESAGLDTENAVYSKVAVGVKNTGDLPVRVMNFALDGVPTPTPGSSELPVVEGQMDSKLQSGDTATLRSRERPLIGGSKKTCNGEERTATLVMGYKRDGGKTVKINYTLSGDRVQYIAQKGCGAATVQDWHVSKQ